MCWEGGYPGGHDSMMGPSGLASDWYRGVPNASEMKPCSPTRVKSKRGSYGPNFDATSTPYAQGFWLVLFRSTKREGEESSGSNVRPARPSLRVPLGVERLRETLCMQPQGINLRLTNRWHDVFLTSICGDIWLVFLGRPYTHIAIKSKATGRWLC